jgi:hypothetical protein
VLCGYLRWDYNATAYMLFHNRYPLRSQGVNAPPRRANRDCS